jgi:predicted GH43/DUF377 family glycosyl hydrolase
MGSPENKVKTVLPDVHCGMLDRRKFLKGAALGCATYLCATAQAADPVAPFRTPYKYPSLVLRASEEKGAFDGRSVDDPIVFHTNGSFYMLYIGFDGTGYQTGLASSGDLLTWQRVALVGPRSPGSRYTKYNLAISSILRDKNLHGTGEAIKVGNKYLAAWNAYPAAGYEEGAAVIGLATSSDLLDWDLTDPILQPQDGEPWEQGGLYRPDLLLDNGTYYLYYNAKDHTTGDWQEQSGVATSIDLRTWTRAALNPLLKNGPRGSVTFPADDPRRNQAPAVTDARDSHFASNPYVVKLGHRFAMFYYGYDYRRPSRACELLALGADPTHFSKVPEVIIDTGAPGTIDETYAHKPSVIYHDGALYHFYCAVSGKYPNEIRGISVARSRPWELVHL